MDNNLPEVPEAPQNWDGIISLTKDMGDFLRLRTLWFIPAFGSSWGITLTKSNILLNGNRFTFWLFAANLAIGLIYSVYLFRLQSAFEAIRLSLGLNAHTGGAFFKDKPDTKKAISTIAVTIGRRMKRENTLFYLFFGYFFASVISLMADVYALKIPS